MGQISEERELTFSTQLYLSTKQKTGSVCYVPMVPTWWRKALEFFLHHLTHHAAFLFFSEIEQRGFNKFFNFIINKEDFFLLI